MKNVLLTLCLILSVIVSFAQWAKKLTLPVSETFDFVSAVDDKVVWGLNNNKQVYISTTAGNSWRKIIPTGIAGNTTSKAFCAVTASIAFLAVNTDFTGIGPGIVYATKDTGKTWAPVFTHAGNCEFNIAMYNNKAGLMTCSFDSFNGSVKTGQQLLRTTNGGKTWTTNGITDPSDDSRLLCLQIRNNNAWIVDGSRIYSSADGGSTWIRQGMPKKRTYYNNLQIVSNDYAVINEGALINMYTKRPGSLQWNNLGDPTGFSGALTCMLLDSSECWFATPFDLVQNFYSNDSAKTFIAVQVDNNGAFNVLAKSRNGRNFWGAASFSRTLWMLDRNAVLFVGKPGNKAGIATERVTVH